MVSVVIPFYSGKDWLATAIESALQQSYKNVEILVINDGSKEDISDLVSKYGEDVHFINQSNGGPSKARNTGIHRSNGKYIAFLDSDDYWFKDKLKLQIEQMEKNESIWSHHSYLTFLDNSNQSKIINNKHLYGYIYLDCFISLKIQTSTIVVLREILINEDIRFPKSKRYGQDLDFYKQIAYKYKIDYIDEILSGFRLRGKNAGFRAVVQLNNKADVWEEIKNDKSLKKLLPTTIQIGYKISSLNRSIFNKINKKITNEKVEEIVAKAFYTIPYLFFKLGNLLRNRRRIL